MEKSKNNKAAKMLTSVARKIGEISVANCWGWYHQPAVPESMKKVDKKLSTN